ncbi:sterol desaturase family protein [Rhodobacteraceae bacterium D3-12]|nr:sterol desaturase family protein [Rhodobacteraceae bacterium D3-12]
MNFDKITEMLTHPFTLFFDPSQRMSILYMVTALIVAIVVFFARKRSLAGLVTWLLPKEILLHPSAKADYVMFFVNKTVVYAIYASIIIQSQFWFDMLTAYMGPAPRVDPSLAITLLTTLVIAINMDAMLWFGHWLFHKIPFLWEFHKVHHSAEVMTPITASRMHPFEEVVTSIMSGFAVGITAAFMDQAFGQGAVMLNIFGINVVLAVFFLAAFNLRHSHVWVRYPVWLQKIFVCPAQHQIHHSKARKHWDKNMGFIFGLWDWAAGTLYAPKTHEKLEYGLGNGEDGTWNKASVLYIRPFVNAYGLFKSGWRNAFFAPENSATPMAEPVGEDLQGEQEQAV